MCLAGCSVLNTWFRTIFSVDPVHLLRWPRPSDGLSVCSVGIHTVTHHWAVCDAVSVHFALTIRRSDTLITIYFVIMSCIFYDKYKYIMESETGRWYRICSYIVGFFMMRSIY